MFLEVSKQSARGSCIAEAAFFACPLETFPSQNRNEKIANLSLASSGYEDDSSGSRDASSDRIPILPKSRSSTQVTEPRRQPGILHFNNEKEFRCFCFYREEVAPRLSCDARSIWQDLLLQVSQSEDFVRHALIAIGGLSRSLKRMSADNLEREDSLTSSSARLREFALKHYDQFLTGTKRALAVATREQGIRLTMISCLLVVCIENMQSHLCNALAHATQGFKLIGELRKDVDEVSHSNGRAGPSAPVSDINEELVQQFDRMELLVLAMWDSREGQLLKDRLLRDQGTPEALSIPETFTDIDDAKQHLDLIMKRTFRFMAYAQVDKRVYLSFDEGQDIALEFDKLGLSHEHNVSDSLQVSDLGVKAHIQRDLESKHACPSIFARCPRESKIDWEFPLSRRSKRYTRQKTDDGPTLLSRSSVLH